MLTRPCVAVIGAGLAGAACARALSLRGLRVTVFEREGQPALGASGNPIGILHPLVSADHNLASQWVEAGIQITLSWLSQLKAQDYEIGSQCPVLQMNAQCSELVMWTYQGAWIRPARFVQACLNQALDQGAELILSKEVRAIHDQAADPKVVLEFSSGETQQFDAVVVSNGLGALSLLPNHQLRLNAIRGTVSTYRISQSHSLPCIVCASGYATPVIDGEMVVGASYERIDDQGVATADSVSNLDRLAIISERLAQICATAQASDRTSIRIATHDRMPHIGRALNTEARLKPSMSLLSHMPRSEKVWVLCGLGSRGLSFAPLGAELIAAQLAKEVLPLAQRLLDAADPVRFALRSHQRRASVLPSC